MAVASTFALCAGSLGGNSYATTATSNLTVTAAVNATCTISAGTLAFGTYDPVSTNASAALDADADAVTVRCTKDAAAKVTLGQGANPTGASTDAAPARQMADGTKRLAYELYSDAGRTSVWGNTDPTGVAHVGTGLSANLRVYGRISGGQNVPAGSYSDTVVATVTF
jgi:spore coat protein U domain-containing protein, fimbrial subunit CupE1/2/3/6